MKILAKLIPLTIALGVALPGTAGSAGSETSEPPSALFSTAALRDVMLHELETIFPEELLADDAAQVAGRQSPQRYALPVDVSITPNSHGTWEQLDDGGWLWRLRVFSPNATDLNFGFSRFHLPEGATLHLVSLDRDYYQGPFGAADNRDHGELWTPVIPGERAVIELYVPAEPAFDPELELATIGRGYRDWFGILSATPKQGSCNIDVVCPEAEGWQKQIQSVAALSIRGTIVCTGNLILDVMRSHRPFFLTAYHCGVTSTNDHTVVTYWNFQSPNCGQLSGGSLDQTVSGSTFLARRRDVDFCLIELDETPPAEYSPVWTGWDRRWDLIPDGSVGIHHPGGDEKAISFNDDALSVGSNCITVGGSPETHWYVDNWEQGTTEAGSSGSGLWDRDSQLLIGFLSGGFASCSNPEGYDCYGRLAAAWDGPSPEERLRDWLDPLDTGVEIVTGEVPVPEVAPIGWPSIVYLPVNGQNPNGRYP